MTDSATGALLTAGFNPHPPIKAGEMQGGLHGGGHRISFNPHPPIKAGEIQTLNKPA